VPDKVLLIVIDAATPHAVCPAIRTGRLPVLQRLVERGAMHESSVSIFPSITPAATSTIATGAYPFEHGIAGASWYDSDRQEVAYYGDDFWVIAKEGFATFIEDFLLRLNGDRLRAPTMFQMIEQTGREAACLNYLVFKGDRPHDARIPPALAAISAALSETLLGPSILALGDFVVPRWRSGKKLEKKGGLLHRFGMDDASTGVMLCDLVRRGALPDFTIAYFADNDYLSHEVGPVAALTALDQIDRMLGEAFDAAGGMDRVLADTVVIVTSDHGHCDILPDGRRAVIRLDRLLANYRQAQLGRAWRAADELMICPNMRAAQIYVRAPEPQSIEAIAGAVLQDPRVDQVMWRTRLTRAGGEGYTVSTHRGRLEFARAAAATSATGTDVFGGAWVWSGDACALAVEQDGRTILFSDYPNAFERIAGALDLDKSGEIWVTAKAGCEFEVPGGEAHVGGASHGALHKLDSLSPVIVAGGTTRHRLPRHMRLVDIAPLCMQVLGIPMRYKVGDPRGVP
jgi:hypothetical protein